MKTPSLDRLHPPPKHPAARLRHTGRRIQAANFRFGPGTALHAFGDAVTDCMAALPERIHNAPPSPTIEIQIDGQVVELPLELKVGYVIYPDDPGRLALARVSSAAAALNLDLPCCHARIRHCRGAPAVQRDRILARLTAAWPRPARALLS